MDDDELVELGMRELEQLGLAEPGQLEFGFVERVPKAYPMYDAEYAERVATIRALARRRSTTSSRSAATACTATTTRTTRCSPRCARSTTSWTAPTTTSGRSTPSRVYHEEGEETDKNPYPYRDGADVPALREPVSESA